MSKIQDFLDLNNNFQENSNLKSILANKISDHAVQIVRKNNSKISKLYSERNRARYQVPIFLEFEDFDILARPKFSPKGDVSCDLLFVKEYKHPKGRLFFVGTSRIIFIFKSHFFDRIGERILSFRPGEKREKSLILALTDFFFKSLNCNLEFRLDNRGTLYLKILNGYALGHAKDINFKSLHKIMIFNTYITENMLTLGQKEYLISKKSEENTADFFKKNMN